MSTINIDIETQSGADLKKVGVYAYVEDSDFSIQLFSYSINSGAVKTVDFTAGETLPKNIITALTKSNVIKVAYNAMFERICLSKWLGMPVGEYLLPEQWHCTLVHASMVLGNPMSLAVVGEILGIEKAKLKEGKRLVSKFCKPHNRQIGLFSDGKDEDWELYKQYNARDVEAEMEIAEKLSRYPVPQQVWDEYAADCRINDRGFLTDKKLCEKAVEMDEVSKAYAMNELHQLTGLQNPNSPTQLKMWLSMQGVVGLTSLSAETVEELLLRPLSADVKRVLRLRQQTSRSSVAKYAAYLVGINSDNRNRGTLQFMETHTGRESGKRCQPHNLPRGELHGDLLTNARELVMQNDVNTIGMIYDDVSMVLSSLIRSAIIPPSGKKLCALDYSAIENRTLAWLAGEQWIIDSYNKGEDVYKINAAKMYRTSYENVTKDQRAVGKVSILAGGYGGGINAYKAFGADKSTATGGLGLSDNDIQKLVNDYRSANPNIVRYWQTVEQACINAVNCSGIGTRLPKGVYIYGITEANAKMTLIIRLPSGRELFYQNARVEVNPYNRKSITYSGLYKGKWTDNYLYGGLLVENITSGTARDILFHAMVELERRGCPIILSVHDEIVMEVEEHNDVEKLKILMSTPPEWAEGLPLKAEGDRVDFYQK